MKLRERYKRLTFWNKVAFWGSIASIISIPTALILWRLQPPVNVEIKWSDIEKELNEQTQDSHFESIATRTFWLLREEGATISFGPCPGTKCFQFKLGKMEVRDGVLTQMIFFDGQGFNIKRDPNNKSLSFNNLIEMKGAWPGISMKDGRLFARIKLVQGAYFIINTEFARIKFFVLDTKTDSLRIRLEIYPN